MDMATRIERLEKLKKEYPELIKALKMAKEVSIITYVLSEDNDVEAAFSNLEELLR